MERRQKLLQTSSRAPASGSATWKQCRRAPGVHRTAENNDLRNLLAAQPVSHMGPTSRETAPHRRERGSKRIDADRVNKSTLNLGMSSVHPVNDGSSQQE